MFFQSTTHSLLQASALLGLTTLAAASSNDPEAPPFLPTSSFAFGSAHSHDSTRPDAHAPIGVMADHVHEAGEWMVSMRYMRMEMDGMRDGTRSLSAQEVLDQGYMVTPLEMTMDMWMLGGMYAPTDSVTLMAMLPYLSNSMDHLTGMGSQFTTESSGLGDLRLSALIPLLKPESGTRVHVETGISLPTGSITERDNTPAMANAKLPYPMQLGSGTYDLILGATAVHQLEAMSFGGQLRGTVRLDENSEGYSLGDVWNATAWGAYALNPETSASLRLAWQTRGNIDGRDGDLNANMVPTADPSNQGQDRLEVGLGLNGNLGGGWRLAGEVLLPLYQDLDGPQMETELTWVLGAQLSF
jgi:hypothetical protein